MMCFVMTLNDLNYSIPEICLLLTQSRRMKQSACL